MESYRDLLQLPPSTRIPGTNVTAGQVVSQPQRVERQLVDAARSAGKLPQIQSIIGGMEMEKHTIYTIAAVFAMVLLGGLLYSSSRRGPELTMAPYMPDPELSVVPQDDDDDEVIYVNEYSQYQQPEYSQYQQPEYSQYQQPEYPQYPHWRPRAFSNLRTWLSQQPPISDNNLNLQKMFENLKLPDDTDKYDTQLHAKKMLKQKAGDLDRTFSTSAKTKALKQLIKSLEDEEKGKTGDYWAIALAVYQQILGSNDYRRRIKSYISTVRSHSNLREKLNRLAFACGPVPPAQQQAFADYLEDLPASDRELANEFLRQVEAGVKSRESEKNISGGAPNLAYVLAFVLVIVLVLLVLYSTISNSSPPSSSSGPPFSSAGVS